MREQIVFAHTADGLTLEGLHVAPVGRESRPPILWLHGLHLTFCEPEYVMLARALAKRGHPVMLVNTRGKGFGAWLRASGGNARLGGSGWEIFQESLIDIAAWLDWATATLGVPGVVVAGHGYGGTKAAYFASQRRDPRVLAVIAASSGSLVRDTLDPAQLELAERMVGEGRSVDLMPFGTLRGSVQATVSAQVYVNRVQVNRDLHGSEQVSPALSRVECPLLAFFGAQEQVAGRDVNGFLDSIARNAASAPFVERALIPGAGYFFGGAELAVAERIARFLARVMQWRGEDQAKSRRAS